MAVYAAAMAELPEHESVDIPTSSGTVRTYRFEGPAGKTPVVLLHGRSASTPMWRANIPQLVTRRPVISVDLLGEPGKSVQTDPITGAVDEARWLDEALTGLGLDRVHLLGVSIGGWTAASHAVHRRGRAASLTLLDPAMTFARLPVKTVLATLPLVVPGAPEALRRRVLSWIAGGADVDDTLPEAALISTGSTDFALTKAPPTLFTDEQLSALDVPVLVLIAGRSVIHDAAKAAARARLLLPLGQVELWPEASHAMNGEFADEIARRAHRFWDEIDAA
jgi:pimeloyl-ACP methyl ester carboxylesterase